MEDVMKSIFAFSLSTKSDYYEKGDIIFSDKGDTLGRVIRRMKVAIPGEEIYYSYDVESTVEDYENIKSNAVKLYKIKEYSVRDCSTIYYES